MASYESLHSLLLQRKEGELKIKDPRTTGLCVDNILGDPNTLATTSTSMVRWTFAQSLHVCLTSHSQTVGVGSNFRGVGDRIHPGHGSLP